MKKMRNLALAVAAGAATMTALAAPALAQRDPAYAAARAAGQVGEKTDGYLGIVGEATPALQRIVDDINIKRRAVYADKARETRSTIEEYALTVGCQTILLRVQPGEKYQAPDGTWLTRTSEPPVRDPRCP